MEEQNGIFKILQDNFLKELNKYSTEFVKEKELSSGNITAFGVFVNDFSSKLVPVLTVLLQEHVKLQQRTATSEMNNKNHTEVIETYRKVQDLLNNWCHKFQNDHIRLWEYVREILRIMVEYANLTNQVYNEYQKTYLELEKSRTEREDLVNKVASLENENKYQFNRLNGLLQNDQLIKNVQKAFSALEESGTLKIKEITGEYEQKISEFLEKEEKMKEDFSEKSAKYEEEINNLKAKDSELMEQLALLSANKESLEKDLVNKSEELERFAKVITRNTTLETAISDLCERFNFIKFDGEKFDCQDDNIKSEDIMKFSLDNKKKQIQQLMKDKEDLQHRIMTLQESKLEQITNMSNLKKNHEDEKSAIITKLEESNKLFKHTKKENNVLSTKLTESETNLKKSKEKIAELEHQLNVLRNGARQQQDDKAAKDKLLRNETIKERIGAFKLQRPRQAFNLSQQALGLADNALRDSNEKLRRENEKLEATINELRSRLPNESDIQEEADSRDDEIRHLREELENVKRENKKLEKKYKHEVSERERLTSKVDDHPPPMVFTDEIIERRLAKVKEEVQREEMAKEQEVAVEQTNDVQMPPEGANAEGDKSNEQHNE